MATELEPELARILTRIRREQGRVVALTGAGISAESGIPTFRSGEGYWVVGSRNYLPQEMATVAMFEREPEQVWRWYLARFGRSTAAEPNAAHHALVALERALGERFHLITQNIDGLHHKAGASRERTYCIHGEAAYVRCADGCTPTLRPLPVAGHADPRVPLSARELTALRCPGCGGWLRPHVLWFDEYYDELYYRADSALAAARRADLLLVVGTTGATSLPARIGELSRARGIAIVDVDPEPNVFAELASSVPDGFFAEGLASRRLPAIVDALGTA
jgi:NAD-dependent deacetylase